MAVVRTDGPVAVTPVGLLDTKYRACGHRLQWSIVDTMGNTHLEIPAEGCYKTASALDKYEHILRYRYASVPPEDTCSLVSGEAREGPECESWRPSTSCEGKSQVLKTCTEEDLDRQEH